MTDASQDRELYRPPMPDEKRRELREAIARSEAKRNLTKLRETLDRSNTDPERNREHINP